LRDIKFEPQVNLKVRELIDTSPVFAPPVQQSLGVAELRHSELSPIGVWPVAKAEAALSSRRREDLTIMVNRREN
jgi:hypothetical protein